MKFTLLAVIAFAAVAQGFVLPVEEVQLNGNVIDNLVREALEYIRGLLKQNEPYTLPAVPQQSIVDPDTGVNLNVLLSNVKISKADDFKVNHIENNLPNLWAKFDLVAPQPQLEGQFTISGKALEKDVSGTGSFSVALTNMEQNGFIQMGLKDHGLFIANMTLDYNLDNAKSYVATLQRVVNDFCGVENEEVILAWETIFPGPNYWKTRLTCKFSISGLDVSGMSEDKINEYLNKHLIPTLNANKPIVCQKVAKQIMEKGNEIMAGKTLKQLIDWLKNLIGH